MGACREREIRWCSKKTHFVEPLVEDKIFMVSATNPELKHYTKHWKTTGSKCLLRLVRHTSGVYQIHTHHKNSCFLSTLNYEQTLVFKISDCVICRSANWWPWFAVNNSSPVTYWRNYREKWLRLCEVLLQRPAWIEIQHNFGHFKYDWVHSGFKKQICIYKICTKCINFQTYTSVSYYI